MYINYYLECCHCDVGVGAKPAMYWFDHKSKIAPQPECFDVMTRRKKGTFF